MVFDTLYHMVPLFKGHLSLTWHSFAALKVFILGIPKCKPDASVFIRCPMSRFAGAGLSGLRRWSLRNPSSIWLHWNWSWRWLSLGNPSSPSWKGDLLVIPIKIATSWGFTPRSWLRIAGGGCSSQSEISWWRSSMSCHAVPGLWGHQALPGCIVGYLPSSVRVASRWIRVTLPLWGWRSWFRGLTSL